MSQPQIATHPLPATTRTGQVSLTVADLDRSVEYYTRQIGLAVLDRTSTQASFGAGDEPLITVVQESGALPADGYTGLFHVALRVPRRDDLAAWVTHAIEDRVPVAGMADHFVSEAFYLTDPDGHGVEIYYDRPRAHWEGQVTRMTTLPLDVRRLLADSDITDTAPGVLPAGTDVGHVHLRVADIPQTIAFYRDVLGFDLMLEFGPQAAFLAAGGYHHHIGANTWQSQGAPPAPADRAGLRFATILFPDAATRDGAADRVANAGGEVVDTTEGLIVRDPAQNALRLAVT